MNIGVVADEKNAPL